MSTVRSSDGTTIAYQTSGNGPPLILVDGALCYREMGPARSLAEALAPHFTVCIYDRRGRGESGDTQPYAVEREVEDIEALIREVGGSAYLHGVSSGGALALEAARRGAAIGKLAVYEAPFIVDDSRPPIPPDYVASLNRALAADRRGEAVKLFMRQVGMPAVLIALTPLMPAWKKLKSVAHTLPYDAATVADNQRGEPLPAGRWRSVTAPTLVGVGGKSPAWMHHGMEQLVERLPNAELRELERQTHMVKAKALGPALVGFFTADNATPARSAI
jgi:pimeloyl-ACP methyl ester carboxylesterase